MSSISKSLLKNWSNNSKFPISERGDRILINTDAIKHIDVIEQASNLDKLYSNGWSHNDILKLRGKPPIDEDWANARRFTKNYATGMDENTKGGDE